MGENITKKDNKKKLFVFWEKKKWKIDIKKNLLKNKDKEQKKNKKMRKKINER